MAISEKLPGMRPGSIVRNIAVGTVYFFGVLIVLGALVGGSGDTDDDESDIESESDEEELEEEQTEAGEEDGPDEEDAEEVEETDEASVEGDDVSDAEDAVEEDTEEELSDEDLIILFQVLVEDQDIVVETAENQGDTFVVEFTTFSQDGNQLAGDVGYVAGAYSGMVDEGYSSDRMEATVLNAAGEEIGTFHVEEEWGEEFASGEMSDEEFGQLVIDTFEAEEDELASTDQSATQVVA